MRNAMWVVLAAALTSTGAANAQLKPGAEVGFQGVALWQQVADTNFSGYVQCDRNLSPNQHKGPICKSLPNFHGAMDVCEGKVQSLSLATDETSIRFVDQSFTKAVGWAEEDFGQPSTLTSGEADWNLGDVQVMVHQTYFANSDEWIVFMDVFSTHSRHSKFGCSVDNGGKYGSAIH